MTKRKSQRKSGGLLRPAWARRAPAWWPAWEHVLKAWIARVGRPKSARKAGAA